MDNESYYNIENCFVDINQVVSKLIRSNQIQLYIDRNINNNFVTILLHNEY